MCTPAGNGAPDSRWDTWRVCEFAEILGFYGLQYWYTWQVSVLGLGPIWMSENEATQAARCSGARARRHLRVRIVGERARRGRVLHRHDPHASKGDGIVQRFKGGKYYIGNGNKAAIVSTFGKLRRFG